MELMGIFLIKGSIIFAMFAFGIWWDFRKEAKSIERMSKRIDQFGAGRKLAISDIAAAGSEVMRDSVDRIAG